MAIKLPTYEEYKQRVNASQPVVTAEEQQQTFESREGIPEEGIIIGAPSASQIMDYGWNVKGRTDMEELGKIGRIKGWYNGGMFDGTEYKMLDEYYGEDFFNLSESEKRNRINQVDREKAIKNNLAVLAYGEENSLLAGAAGLAGTLATPTTFVPGLSWAKYGAKGLAVTSAMFGAEYNLLDQYADKGSIDMGELAYTTGISAGFGLGLGVAGKGLVRLFSNTKAVPLAQRSDVQQKADEIQDIMYDAVEEDIPIERLHEYIKSRTGYTSDELVSIVKNAERKPELPANKAEVAEAKELNRIEIDADTINSNPTVNKYITPIIEGFARIDEVFGLNNLLKNKVNGYFFKSYTNAMEKIRASHDILNAYKQMPSHAQKTFDNLLLNADKKQLADAKALLEKYVPNTAKSFDDFMNRINTMTKELKANGIKVPDTTTYVPRIVKDSKGLKKFLNQNPVAKTAIDKALKMRADALKIDPSKLSVQDKNFIVSNILQGRYVGTNKKGELYARKRPTTNRSRETFLETRKIHRINEQMQEFYESPLQSTMRYFMDAHKLIEKRNFFGVDNSKMLGTGLDLDKSAENFLATLADKNLDIDTQGRLQEMFKAIFVDADRSLGKYSKGYKDLVNASLLANPLSALQQGADVFMGAWRLGIANVAKGLFKQDVNIVKDLNIDQLQLEHFSSGTSMAGLVDNLLEFTQFKRMDRVGKTAIVNGAWQRVQNMVKTDKGIAKLRKQYGTAFGPEFNKFIDEVKNAEMTPRTKEYLFNELAEFQPITPAQMPEAYLKADMGRLAYTLQSFTIKQINLIRKHIIDEARRGNYAEAGKNLLGFALLIPPANMAIDYGKERLLGKDPDLSDDLVRRYANNALKVFGSSEYAVSRLTKTGKFGDFVQDTFMPPMEMFDGLIQTSFKAIQNGEFDPAVTKQLPIVGRLLYYYAFGGLEEWNDKEQAKKKRQFKEKYGIDKKKYGIGD
jgi:hypothetical protein